MNRGASSFLVPIFAAVLALATFGCNRAETIDASQFDPAEWEQCLKDPGLDEKRFTRLYAQAMAAQFKDARVEITGEREVSVRLANGGDLKAFLDNAWAEASNAPEDRPAICRRYIAALVNSARARKGAHGPPDTNSIVVVVRNRSFLQESRTFAGTTNQPVSEPLVADLQVFYVSDSETGMAYLTEGDRKALGLNLSALRQLALSNLERILPRIERHGSGPVFMIVADGNYESSLLLNDKLWHDEASSVQGEIVAAVPSRDVLLFTGSASPQGVQQMRQLIDEIQTDGARLISKAQLVRRNDHWEPFTE